MEGRGRAWKGVEGRRSAPERVVARGEELEQLAVDLPARDCMREMALRVHTGDMGELIACIPARHVDRDVVLETARAEGVVDGGM